MTRWREAKLPESLKTETIWGEFQQIHGITKATGSGTFEEKVTNDSLEKDLSELLPRTKQEDAAREQFLDLLEQLGSDSPRATEWRRKLSRELF